MSVIQCDARYPASCCIGSNFIFRGLRLARRLTIIKAEDFDMTSRLQHPDFGLLPTVGGSARAAWSKAISSRADVKLAPCMARPNLFSGD